MDCLALENQVIEGMMGQLRMVRNFNNMLIRQWDPGHVDVGNEWGCYDCNTTKATLEDEKE